MSLVHKFLKRLYKVMQWYQVFQDKLYITESLRIRVLIYHDIQLEKFDLFESQVEWIKKQDWQFLKPNEFIRCIGNLNNHINKKKRNIMFSFDDGFKSNRILAETVLAKFGIKGIFFVVSDFVDIKGLEECRRFISKHIWPGIPEEKIYHGLRNMNWDDLKWLLDNGHIIGAHTKSHPRLSEIKNAKRLEEEIVECGDILERRLGVKIEHFAFPFGNIESISPVALKIAKQRYRYVYTGIRGNNFKVPYWAIRRDAVKPDDPFDLLGAFLEGAADIYYSLKFAKYKSWGQH